MITEKPPKPSLTPADYKFAGIVAVIACFISGMAAFYGQLWLIMVGGLIVPAAFICRAASQGHKIGIDWDDKDTKQRIVRLALVGTVAATILIIVILSRL